MAKKQADGNHVIYHYLQKVVGVRDDPQSRQIITQLLTDLSIWLPPNLYRELPILLPFCLRDPSCRESGPNGEDEWGSATSAGFLRDDNSLLKGVVASFVIRSPKIDVYNNAKRGRGFVASHVWREITLNGHQCLASRRPETYTFVPNVAWLPSQLSKLTDREGSLAQKVLQALSHQIYGPHRNCHPPFIASLWTALPRPEVKIEVDLDQLNYFVAEDTWIQRRKRDLLSEMDRIRHTIRTRQLPAKKVKCSRYLPSVLAATNVKEGGLLDWLDQYESLLTAGDSAAES